MKRFLAVFLSLVLVLSAMPGGAMAKKQEEKPQDKHSLAKEATRRSYTRSLRTAKKTTFSGYCGMLSSHQLWHMGVNSWCASYNGKDQYDAYCDREITSGGYYIRPYSGNEYGLEDALETVSENGTKDVYNILVGFQRTKTTAGRKYGHAMVINAILDGTVYFVESSNTDFGPEGKVITCSIEKFAEHYNRSMDFEGIIHFGKNYTDICHQESAELYLQARFDSVLRTQSAVVGNYGCRVLRSVSAGERLQATAMITDPNGDLYYQITEDEQVGYIAAAAVSVLQVNEDAGENKNGWFLKDGTWFCYEDGNPGTGWTSWCGATYYLLDNGAVSVGWSEIDGKEYYFSLGGALTSGWLTQGGDVFYRRESGELVAGWLTVDGLRYCFDESGVLMTNTEVADGEVMYVLAADGKASVKIEED